ncbi:MAG TPA: DUF5681 domain-containing protein [Gallionella sp.]|nr:DUF5681 domain-containing protein [Gallionella sp.]
MAFKKGQSGNPSGKPRGARDKRTELRLLLEPHREALVQLVVDKALAGDGAALRICIDRLIAPVRSNPVRIENFTGTLAERGEAVIAAIGKGELGIDEASALMSVLQSQARIIEASELDARIAALEKVLLN